MDDFADALERGVEFFRFETKQRYTRGVFAVRQEILRLQATRESRFTANSVGGRQQHACSFTTSSVS
jgi:hypothetical protein